MLLCFHRSRHRGPGRLCHCFVCAHASWVQSRNRHQKPGGFQWTFLSVSVHLQTQCWLAGSLSSCRLLWLPQSSVFEKHHGSKWLHNKASGFLTGRLADLEKKRSPPILVPSNTCSDGKESACNARDLGSLSGKGRWPREGNGYPLHYSCRENSTDRGAWQAPVHGVAKSRTRLSD